MNEQFDRALRNHIRDTFDHYDDLMANDGWNKFHKQKNRKKRGLIFWYGLPSGIAAALALLWIFNATTNEVIKSKTDQIAQTNKTIIAPNAKPKTLEESKVEDSVELSKHKVLVAIKTNDVKENLPRYEAGSIYNLVVEAKNRTQIATIQAVAITFDGFKPDYEPTKLIVNKASFIKNTPKPIAEQEFLAFNNQLLNNKATDIKSNTTEKPAQKKKDSNFNFSVDANTFYSFTAAGISDDLDLGVGVLSALKLTKRLSVNSGISLSQQSVVYQNQQQGINSQGFNSQSSPNSLISSVGKGGISVPEGVTTNAKLVGFDIPLNLKYDIPLGKAKTFITTGISSYSLLNQSYTNDVSVVNYSLTSSPTTSVLRNVEKEKDGAFSNFQFARTLNFSFGVLYPLSIKNSISVEPFVKYPIAGFGNRDLEVGSGGVSFKLNFGK